MHERQSCGDKECMQRNDLLKKLLAAETEQKQSLNSVLKETRTSKLNVLIKA